jgi:hypothetical protein
MGVRARRDGVFIPHIHDMGYGPMIPAAFRLTRRGFYFTAVLAFPLNDANVIVKF